MPHPYNRIAQATIVSRLHGQECNNVLHFGVNPAEIALIQLAVAIVTCLVSTFRPMTSDEWVLQQVNVREIWPNLGDPVEYIHTSAVSGTGLPTSPSFVAYLMRVRTGKGGKSNRGRHFFPGVVENDVTQSRLTDSSMEKFLAFCNCLRDAFIRQGELAAPDFEIGVLSRTRAKIVGQSAETAFTPATQLVPVREVAVMRSRRIGHGS